jgi:uncharacterized membrane protein
MPPIVTDPNKSPTIPLRSNHILSALLVVFFMTGLLVALFSLFDHIQYLGGFTEFYLKDTSSLLKTNKLELFNNKEEVLKIVITNHERVTSNYKIWILTNDDFKIMEVGTLENNGVIEVPIPISFPTIGDNQKIDLFLEKQGSDFPYRALHLFANVNPSFTNTP